MVVGGAPAPPDVNNIMGGLEQTTNGVRMHNHRRKLRQRFDLVRKLGQGTYGKVQLGVNKETGQEVAIKTIKKAKIETEADLIRIRREIQIMSSVRHPNIIHIYEVFENKEKMVLVMEYAAGGELYDYLSQRKVLSETEARRIFRQVASAVYYCHKHQICHRDLKLENILLDEAKGAKIADFGLSNVFDNTSRRLLSTFCGSPLYASPEIVRGTPYIGPEVDCWSLGVLLYTLVYGAMPFDGSNFKRLVKQISSGDYYEPTEKPSTASPLVRQMLLVDPTKRASIENICSHWWVNEGYGESCLEMAEELANETPVRLDLLLSLIPPQPDSAGVQSPTGAVSVPSVAPDETIKTVIPTTTTTTTTTTKTPKTVDGDESNSMNEYYDGKTAVVPTAAGAEPTEGTKTKKKKDVSSSSPSTQRSKKRRAETVVEENPLPPTDPLVDETQSCGPSPIDDSGIQSTIEAAIAMSEEIVAAAIPTAVAVASADAKKDSGKVEQKPSLPPDVDMDEGIVLSTSNSATKVAAAVEPVAVASSAPTAPLCQKEPSQPVDRKQLKVQINNDLTEKMMSNENETTTSGKEEKQTTPLTPPSPPSPPTASVIESPQSPEPEATSSTSNATRRPRNSSSASSAASEHRHSKILLRQAELFNNLTHARTDPPAPKNTMTLERPKKVTLYGFKVNDARKAFETRTDVYKPPAVVPVLKVSDAKKAFENTAAAAAAKPERPAAGSQGHHSLPRRTLIQTPANVILTEPVGNKSAVTSNQTQQRNADKTAVVVQPGEKVVVGGLGVKIGAIGKVTEIGMQVTTEVSPGSNALVSPTTTEIAAASAITPVAEAQPIPTTAMAPAPVTQTAQEKPKSPRTENRSTVNSTSSQDEQSGPRQIKTVKDGVKDPSRPKISTITTAAAAPSKATRQAEPTREIQVMIDAGGTQPKMASMIVSGASSSPTSPTTPTPTQAVNKSTPERVTSPVPVQAASAATTPPQRVVSPLPTKPPLPTRALSPPLSARALSPPLSTRALSPPLSSRPLSPSAAQLKSRPLSPPPLASRRTLSPPPLARPMSPSLPPLDAADCITGSENTFIRCIRSPIREVHSPTPVPVAVATTTTTKKSKLHLDDATPEPTPTRPLSPTSPAITTSSTTATPAPVMQKAEINIAVSAASLSPTPRERIIPIRLESAESMAASSADNQQQKPRLVTSVSVDNKPAKSLQQQQVNQPSVASHPATINTRVSSPPPLKTVRPNLSSRQESVTSPLPPTSPVQQAEATIEKRIKPIPEPVATTGANRDPAIIRKSPREFIIPITIEGGGVPDNSSGRAAAIATNSSNTSSLSATASTTVGNRSTSSSRFDRNRRFGSLLSNEVDDFMDLDGQHQPPSVNGSSHQSQPESPLHHLQRLSSFKKSYHDSMGSERTGGGRSSPEEDDDDDDDLDDDTFQILTAESLFSSLLSRVRQLTRRSQRGSTGEPSDPFASVFSRHSRFASPAPRSTSSRTAPDDDDRFSCSSPINYNNNNIGSASRNNGTNNNRNSICSSDLPSAMTSPVALLDRGWSNSGYSRTSSVTSESDSRRYSTLDHLPSSPPPSVGPPWRNDAPRGSAVDGINGNDGEKQLLRPFTSSLTRRFLKQHLRETNPEWQQQQQQQQSDAMSEASSASGGNRSSLSWALSRLGNVLGPTSESRVYNRTNSNRELTTTANGEAGMHRRSYQRYGRSSTLDNLENSVQGINGSGGGRSLSILSDEDAPSNATTPASYRSYTRTRSREYFSPERAMSPVTTTGNQSTAPPTTAPPPNAIVPQLSTVMEVGPLGVEGEVARNSPKTQRKDEPPQPATVTTVPEEPKSRRISRFLRPDFYDLQQHQPTNGQSESNSKERFLKSVEQRWEKINNGPQEEAKSVTSPTSPVTAVERIIPVLRAAVPPAQAATATGPPSTASLLQARQNLQPIPTPAPATAPSAPASPQPVVTNGNSPPKASTISLPPSESVTTKATNNCGSNKNSPKLTVRRQFEHLINLAAAQFQRSASPNKSQQVQQQTQMPHQMSTSSQNAEAISLELKELEDEIRNTAAIKAQAAAKLDALKYQHALKSGTVLPPGSKPAVPVKPDHLQQHQQVTRQVQTTPAIPSEFLPFQYNGTNGALRDLSSKSRPMSPPPSSLNGNRVPAPFGFDDESVRFARIKRVEPPQQQQQQQPDSAEIDGTATPTDSYESSSVCSDLRGDLRGDRGLGGGDSDDESVSERIFRKSFYSRFNEPSKTKQQQIQRRSFTNKDLLNLNNNTTANDSSSNLAGGGVTQSSPQSSSDRHRRRSHRNSRDESAEAVMVRKFISSTAASCAEPVHYLLDRERRSLIRTDPETDHKSQIPVPSSREPSIARSVDLQPASADAQPAHQQQLPPSQPRPYTRNYSSRLTDSNSPLPPLPPTSPTPSDSQYSSASLGRRSYYSTAAAGEHYSGSLPRRTNRYSIQEHSDGSSTRSAGSSASASVTGRSSYVTSPSSRYSSIFEETSIRSEPSSSLHNRALSPSSSRRHPNLSDAVARRESTFYGLPSLSATHHHQAIGSSSSTRSHHTPSSPSYYSLRSTSTGLDYNGPSVGSSSSSYATTTRPSSYLRYRR